MIAWNCVYLHCLKFGVLKHLRAINFYVQIWKTKTEDVLKMDNLWKEDDHPIYVK